MRMPLPITPPPATRPRVRILGLVAVLLATAWIADLPQAALADAPELSRAELIGLDLVRERMGDATPTGRGVTMGHVEGHNGEYMPDKYHNRFEGVTFVPRSGDSETLNHAQRTAGIIYGRRGLAPGVEVVHCYSTHGWLAEQYLYTRQPRMPGSDRIDVINHSWIAHEQPNTIEMLRRADLAADRHDVIIVGGVNNRRGSSVPALMASTYNAIAVGTAGGTSSGGLTHTDGEGRSKPDIAGPEGVTSFATPVVSAVAAMLVEAALAREDAEHASRARRAETIKVLLMAGATKPWNWRQRDGHPLDEFLGAGVVNVDQSLRILDAGPVDPDASHVGYGWDSRAIDREQTIVYEIEADAPAEELSAVLTWHRRISSRLRPHPVHRRPALSLEPRVARLELRLDYVSPDGQEGVIAESLSEVDNVQHVYLRDAPPGRYRLHVRRLDDGHDEPWDYAVAWRIGEHVPYRGDDP
ncbi:MAG: S8 family serine peptidase [Phycisphaeraceae bacterium]